MTTSTRLNKHTIIIPIDSSSSSTDDNQTYSSSDNLSPRSLSSLTSMSSTGSAVPPEIALMHQKTNTLLDSIRSNGQNSDMISLPSMEDEIDNNENGNKHSHGDLEENFSFDLESYMDERSYASYISDDDGMRNEVDQLDLAILEMKRELADSSEFELMVGGFDDYDDETYDGKESHQIESKRAKVLRLVMIILASYSFLSVMKSKLVQYNIIEQDTSVLESTIPAV